MAGDNPLRIKDIKALIYRIQSSVNHRDIELFTQDGFKNLKSKHAFLGYKLLPHHNLYSWLNKVIDTEMNFMIIIYKVHLWYEELIEKLKPFITSKFNREQIKNIKFAVSVLLGHYQFTPFGIHIDDVDFVYHFNVGNKDKMIYYWDEAPLFLNKYEPQNILNTAYLEIIEAGGVYELNPKRFHIGSSKNGISFDFVLTATVK